MSKVFEQLRGRLATGRFGSEFQAYYGHILASNGESAVPQVTEAHRDLDRARTMQQYVRLYAL